MKVWTDKDGVKLTPKQFLERWRQGMQGVTPLQQSLIQVKSTWIIIVGVIAGLVIALINFKTLWWLFIILLGALGNTSVQLIGILQKKKLLEDIKDSFEKSLEGGNEHNGFRRDQPNSNRSGDSWRLDRISHGNKDVGWRF